MPLVLARTALRQPLNNSIRVASLQARTFSSSLGSRSLSTSISLTELPEHNASSSSSSSSNMSSSRRFMATSAGPQAGDVKQITVFGAGLMGAGIAQAAAQVGFQVVMSDVTDKALKNGLDIISKSLSRVAKKMGQSQSVNVSEGGEATKFDEKKWQRECLERIKVTTDAAEAVAQSDLVVEAIIESMKIKNELFAFIDKKAKSSCIFASNTSSLSVAEIGSPVSEERKRKFGGLHFFNPVPAMKLVEIIRTPHTDDATIDTLTQVTLAMKKVPVHCKDTPGFIVNRLLMPYLLESVRMMERGEATAEDIDKAMELGAGYPMGPFKLLDFIGLDTTAHISGGWRAKAEEGLISKEIVAPVPTIEKLIKEGKFGRKSGHGFYDYSSKL